MADIESSCTFKMSDNDTAEISACGNAGDALIKEIDKCIKPSKSLEDSCSCFISNITSANLDKVKSCNISGNNDAAKEAKKSCTKSMREIRALKLLILLSLSGFSKCKKAEDAAVEIVDQCKPERKCGGAGTKEEAEKQLAVLSP